MKKIIFAMLIAGALTVPFAGAALAGPPTEQPGNASVDVCNLSQGNAVFC